jgi:hypothetical protein
VKPNVVSPEIEVIPQEVVASDTVMADGQPEPDIPEEQINQFEAMPSVSESEQPVKPSYFRKSKFLDQQHLQPPTATAIQLRPSAPVARAGSGFVFASKPKSSSIFSMAKPVYQPSV